MKKKRADQGLLRRVLIVAALLFVLFFFSSCAALLLQMGSPAQSGTIAVIPLHGIISTSDSTLSEVVSSSDTIRLLEQARDDDAVEAVILEINSPGGSPVASDEIGRAVQDLRAHNKSVVAWIREVGASGAYWVASNTEHIVANRMSITGSIGVTGSSFGFEEFIDEHNITYRQLTSGDRKELGSPFTSMTREERAFLQEKLEEIHRFFIEEVATNRNMTFEEAEALATGEFFLGFEAEQVGLVDELGGYEEALTFLENKGIARDTFRLEHKRSFWQELTRVQVTLTAPANNMQITT